ncbi:MAG: hypothetical protein NC209_02260 [Alistipes sp.]|nr:hypothetical protein [Alistipes senegalensis]MCM1249952.1 hypothetical protein [Alistipes sp.]
MKALSRFMAVMAVVFFVLALVAAWRVVMSGSHGIWYVPVVLALASASMIFGSLRFRGQDSQNE